jgi:propanediol utilization protein
LTEEQIREIVSRVAGDFLPPAASLPAPAEEVPMEISARHVHLTQAAVEALFGAGAALEAVRPLSQPGEFLSDKRLKLVTARGELGNVAVLGPPRKAVQAEISFTDARALGLRAPLRLSGNLSGAADVCLIGTAGMLFAPGSVIVARSHIHMPPADAARLGVADGQSVCVRANTARPLTFEDVPVRVHPNFRLAMHVDFDEANACALGADGVGVILRSAAAAGNRSAPPQCGPALSTREKVLTETLAKELARAGKPILLRRGTIITPAAKDVFTAAKLPVEWMGEQGL